MQLFDFMNYFIYFTGGNDSNNFRIKQETNDFDYGQELFGDESFEEAIVDIKPPLPTGITVEGVLRDFEPFMNMVLDESIGTNKAREKESIGILIYSRDQRAIGAKLFFKNAGPNVTEEQLKPYFEQFGHLI